MSPVDVFVDPKYAQAVDAAFELLSDITTYEGGTAIRNVTDLGLKKAVREAGGRRTAMWVRSGAMKRGYQAVASRGIPIKRGVRGGLKAFVFPPPGIPYGRSAERGMYIEDGFGKGTTVTYEGYRPIEKAIRFLVRNAGDMQKISADTVRRIQSRYNHEARGARATRFRARRRSTRRP